MKRLLRWMIGGFTLLSLLLCLATAVFWIRSYQTGDTLIIVHCTFRDNVYINRQFAIVLGNGTMRHALEINTRTNPPPEWLDPTAMSNVKLEQPGWRVRTCVNPPDWCERSFFPRSQQKWDRPGIRLGSVSSIEHYDERGNVTIEKWAVRTSRYSKRVVDLRCWLIVTLTAMPTAVYVLRCIVRRPLPPGHCRCGYDLRASKDRCPECGTPVPSPANFPNIDPPPSV